MKQFRRNYLDLNRGLPSKGTALYRALRGICIACPAKANFCPNTDATKITREEIEVAPQS